METPTWVRLVIFDLQAVNFKIGQQHSQLTVDTPKHTHKAAESLFCGLKKKSILATICTFSKAMMRHFKKMTISEFKTGILLMTHTKSSHMCVHWACYTCTLTPLCYNQKLQYTEGKKTGCYFSKNGPHLRLKWGLKKMPNVACNTSSFLKILL